MDYNEIIKERLKILPEGLKSFVLGDGWRADSQKICKQFNLVEDKYVSFENEIFLVLLCFEPKKDFTENIKTELGLDANVAGWVNEDVEKNIFSKVADDMNFIWKVIEVIDKESAANTEDTKQSEATQEETNETQEGSGGSGVGQSFEDIILNQAKAMMPAVEPPNNLPTEQEKPNVIHNYIGSDPYREPAE
jgi:hypothetical protein